MKICGNIDTSSQIVSKSIKVSNNKVGCSFGLSKEGPTLSDYNF